VDYRIDLIERNYRLGSGAFGEHLIDTDLGLAPYDNTSYQNIL